MNRLISKLTLSTLLLIGTATTSVLISAPIAVTQEAPTEKQIIDNIKAVTVQIDSLSEQGTGIIISKQGGNNYRVLTNRHVVHDKDNQYQIITVDGKTHNVSENQITRFEGADLAIISFTSNNNYQTASIGDSEKLSVGDIIHYGGYLASGTIALDRTFYALLSERIRAILSKNDTEDGYQFIISGEAISGLAGSGIVNSNGQLIAIYSAVKISPMTGQHNILAIPINTAVNLAKQKSISLSSN